MNQRAVALVADYLSKRPKGRIVRVMPMQEGDYLMAIEDRRDGRVQLIQSIGDLERWIESFRQGVCVQPVGAICFVCDGIHTDRGLDGELFTNCVGCQVELLDVVAEFTGEPEGDL